MKYQKKVKLKSVLFIFFIVMMTALGTLPITMNNGIDRGSSRNYLSMAEFSNLGQEPTEHTNSVSTRDSHKVISSFINSSYAEIVMEADPAENNIFLAEPAAIPITTVTIPQKPIDIQIRRNNNTLLSEYDMMVNNYIYQAYFLSISDQGDMFRYESARYPGNWYSEHLEEWAWIDFYGSDDYLGANLGVTGTANANIFNYTEILNGVDIIFNATPSSVLSKYVLDAMPNAPPEWMVAPITLSFGFMFEVSANTIMVIDENAIWDKKTSFTTNQSIFFCFEEPDFNLPSLEMDVQGLPEWRITSTVFELPAPYAIDALGNRVDGYYEVQVKGNSFWIYKKIPYEWLLTANYPVRIDPTVVDTTTEQHGFYSHQAGYTDSVYHYCIYDDGGDGVVTRVKVGDASNYDTTVVYTGTDTQGGCLTGWDNGSVYVFYCKNNPDDIVMRASDNYGDSWGPEVPIETDGIRDWFFGKAEIALSGAHEGRMMVAGRIAQYDAVIWWSDDEFSTVNEVKLADDSVWGDCQTRDIVWLYDDIWIAGVQFNAYPGGNFGGLYRSTNGGVSWTMVANYSVYVAPQMCTSWNTTTTFSSTVISYGVTGTDWYFLESINSGSSWTEVVRTGDSQWKASGMVADGATDGSGYWVFDWDDDGAGAVDDLSNEQRGTGGWADPLSWVDVVSNRDKDDYSGHAIADYRTNKYGQAGMFWYETQSSPWNVVFEEITLNGLSTAWGGYSDDTAYEMVNVDKGHNWMDKLNMPNPGQGVCAAIVDTGVHPHEDLMYRPDNTLRKMWYIDINWYDTGEELVYQAWHEFIDSENDWTS